MATTAATIPASPNVTPVASAESSILGTYKRAPMEFVRGDGVWLYDAGGRRYLDFVSGIATNALGYGDAGLVHALHAAADGLVHVSNLYRSAPGETLAAKLVQLARPWGAKAFFCNSGAEANEAAFKFARRWARGQHTHGEGESAKHEIIALRGAFHGRTMGVLAATDRAQYRMPFRPLAGGITILERDLEELAAALDPDTAAAVIVEPVQGEGGVRVLDHGFLRELRTLTRERDCLLILDEIQCGMGRTGTFYAHEQAGIAPDMVTLAKPLAGGLPMGSVVMTGDVAAAIRPGDHGTTFGGGPFIASVANYVVDRLSDPAMLAHVRELGAWFGGQLEELALNTGGRIRQVRGVGLMWGIDVSGTAAHVVSEAAEQGLLLCTAGEYTVRILPPLVVTKEELTLGLRVLEDIL